MCCRGLVGEKFKRKPIESIRVVKTRLYHLVRALIIHPVSKQPGIQNSTLRQKLKQVVHPKMLNAIDIKENEYRNQGLTIPIGNLVDLIDEEERRYGKPKGPVHIPVALYNMETTPPQVHNEIEAELFELETQLNNICDNVDVNRAVVNKVRFNDGKDATP